MIRIACEVGGWQRLRRVVNAKCNEILQIFFGHLLRFDPSDIPMSLIQVIRSRVWAFRLHPETIHIQGCVLIMAGRPAAPLVLRKRGRISNGTNLLDCRKSTETVLPFWLTPRVPDRGNYSWEDIGTKFFSILETILSWSCHPGCLLGGGGSCESLLVKIGTTWNNCTVLTKTITQVWNQELGEHSTVFFFFGSFRIFSFKFNGRVPQLEMRNCPALMWAEALGRVQFACIVQRGSRKQDCCYHLIAVIETNIFQRKGADFPWVHDLSWFVDAERSREVCPPSSICWFSLSSSWMCWRKA